MKTLHLCILSIIVQSFKGESREKKTIHGGSHICKSALLVTTLKKQSDQTLARTKSPKPESKES